MVFEAQQCLRKRSLMYAHRGELPMIPEADTCREWICPMARSDAGSMAAGYCPAPEAVDPFLPAVFCFRQEGDDHCV